MNCTHFKRTLASKQKACLAWNHTGASYSSEICAQAGFDGVILDMEHGPFSVETAVQHCQAISAYPCTPFARVAHHSPHIVKRVLDAGIYGIMLPQISSTEEARDAVRATKYPPQGVRGVAKSARAAGFGYNPQEYFDRANNDIFVMLMIETISAVRCLEDIIGIEGIDGIFIGAVDLASSMGFLGRPEAQEVQETIAHIEALLMPSKIYLGTTANEETMHKKFSDGYDFLVLLSDAMVLSAAAHRIVRSLKHNA